MGIRQERRLATLNRVYALCTLDPLPPGLTSSPPGFATQVGSLKDIITTVSSLMTAQGAGYRITAHSTVERQALRKALRNEELMPLAHVAKSLERDHPGISTHFRVPPWNAREAQLIGTASTMAAEAAKPDFVSLFSAQLGTDFLDRLNSAIKAITSSGDTNEQGRRGQISATAGVDTALAEGNRVVQYLRSIVKAGCSVLAKTDPVAAAQTLRRFESAARIGQVAQVAKVGDAGSSASSPLPAAGAGGSTTPAGKTAPVASVSTNAAAATQQQEGVTTPTT